jgi:hypothetical protein
MRVTSSGATMVRSLVIGVCLVLSLSAATLAFMTAAGMAGSNVGDDAEIRISGIGNSGNGPFTSTHRLSRRAAELPGVPHVSDADIEQIVAAVRQKAQQGDVDAAMFVLDLAAVQRTKPTQTATK